MLAWMYRRAAPLVLNALMPPLMYLQEWKVMVLLPGLVGTILRVNSDVLLIIVFVIMFVASY